MSEPKRYAWVNDGLSFAPDGDLVSLGDYEAIAAEADRLRAELATANTTIETLRMTEPPKGWLVAPKADWDANEAKADRLRALIVEFAEAEAEWHRAGFGNFSKVYNKATKRMDAATAALLAAAAGKQDEEGGEKRRVGDLIWGSPDIAKDEEGKK